MHGWQLYRAMAQATLGSVGLLLIVSACTPASGEPGASQRPTQPSPSPAWVTYSSERYDYSIRHPEDMEMLERPGQLQLAALRPRHPGTDTLGTASSHKFDVNDGLVVIGARELQPGESLEEFTDAASAATRCGPHGFDTTTLDGEPAELRKFECGGTRWHQITALHGGRAYLVWVTRPLTSEILDGFTFTD